MRRRRVMSEEGEWPGIITIARWLDGRKLRISITDTDPDGPGSAEFDLADGEAMMMVRHILQALSEMRDARGVEKP